MDNTQWICIGLAIFLGWLFKDDFKIWLMGASHEDIEQQFLLKSEAEDYQKIKRTLETCRNPKLLDACYQLILNFEANYGGKDAERMARELMEIYDKKEKEVLLLN